MALSRNYSFKDVDMLLASKTIIETLKLNLADLAMARGTWTEEYVNSLSAKIDLAIEKYLGLDKKKELRVATAQLAAIQAPAMRDLAFIKTQIAVDFGSDSKEIIKTLGFDKNLRSVQNGKQDALVELLLSFKKGLTDSLRTQLIAKGTNSALLDRIISYADQLMQTNITQESLKGTTKVLSEEALIAFNEIHNEVIGICKIASSFLIYDPLKREQFTFTKVIKNMGSAKKATVTVSEPATK